MKKIAIFIAVLFLMPFYTMAQDDDEIRTLLNGSVGGYGAFSIGYGQFSDEAGLTAGFRGATILGHSLAIGIDAKGFFTNVNSLIYGTEDYQVTGGYGGLLIEPILLGKFPIHLSIPISLGGGAYGFVTNPYYDYEFGDAFLYIEPGLEFEFNLTKHFRMALGAYYRNTYNLEVFESTFGNKIEATNGYMNGLSFGVILKSGKF